MSGADAGRRTGLRVRTFRGAALEGLSNDDRDALDDRSQHLALLPNAPVPPTLDAEVPMFAPATGIRSRTALTTLALALASSGLAAQVVQQNAPRLLDLHTTSDAAKAALRTAISEQQNLAGAPRIRAAAARAVAADTSFALARVFQAFVGPGTGAERAQTITSMLPALANASAGELLLATAWRESAAGRAAVYQEILRSVTNLAPDDSAIAYAYWITQRTGKTPAERVAAGRDFEKRFPTFAPIYNQVAYDMQAAGDAEGARAEIEQYVKLAPMQPNGLDTYAEILSIQGRWQEAMAKARAVIAMDSAWAGTAAGYLRLGIIQTAMGDGAAARASFARRNDIVPSDANRLSSAQWTAITYVVAGDRAGAMRELGNLMSIAQTANNAAGLAGTHQMMAIVEAFLGDKSAAAGHLKAGETGRPTAQRAELEAIVYSRIGDVPSTRAAVAEVRSLIAPTNVGVHTFNALLAATENDQAAASRELADAPNDDLFANALRADMLAKQGKSGEAAALRKQVASSPVNTLGNATVDVLRVLAHLQATRQ
jgi:tetratricopeptide (TPR) repeat protein